MKSERTEPSHKAQAACAKWLTTCLKLGYQKEQLDALEKIWWIFHDFDGKIITEHPEVASQPPQQGPKS